jgi:NADPH:quinone reductase-like Zn-dependent oxidoreductase
VISGLQVERFGGPDVLKMKDTFVVPPLTPTQVLVKVMYFGVNPVETYIREGQYSR